MDYSKRVSQKRSKSAWFLYLQWMNVSSPMIRKVISEIRYVGCDFQAILGSRIFTNQSNH